MKRAIFILIFLLCIPINATKTRNLREQAKEFDRRSRNLEEIDDIIEMEREIRRQSRRQSLSRTRSMEREIEDELRDTRRCFPLVSGIFSVALNLINLLARRSPNTP